MGKHNDFRDKPRTFLAPDTNHIANILTNLKNQEEHYLDVIDQTVKNRTVHISDNRGEIAKDMVRASFNVLVSYDRNGFAQNKHLSTKDQRRILTMVEEVLNGKREAIQFQLTRNCDGVKELYSREVFQLLDRK